MEIEKLLRDFANSLSERTKVTALGDSFKISVPLLEPNGDQIYVYVEERGDKIKVHDGGHINGILFGAGPDDAVRNEYRLASEIMANVELKMDSVGGVVFAETEERSLNYWIMEVARTIAVIASVVPVNTLPQKRTAKSR
jgi:hypothetical protein